MVIMHNLAAMNANRMLGINYKKNASMTEKLSSGYKINRAADDAAGLAISEKMRMQIRGLRQGMDNIQDGISFCNIADGALNEVHAMLHRLEELGVKAANGTLGDNDREAIDDEVQTILEEIDRVGTTTVFNEIPVFQEVGKQSLTTVINPTTDNEFFNLLGGDTSQNGYMDEPLAEDLLATLPNTGSHDNGDNPYVSVHIDFSKLINSQNNQITDLIGKEFYVNFCTNCCPNHIIFTDEAGIKDEGYDIYIGLKKPDGSYYDDASEFCKYIVDAGADVSSNHVEYACDNNGTLYIYDIDNNSWSENSKKLAYFCDVPQSSNGKAPGIFEGVRIQMSGNLNDYMVLNIGELSTDVLQIDACDCLTCAGADKLIEKTKEANEILSAQRVKIGAYVNRLEHSYNSNSNVHENTVAAESRIRDTDMASEMVRYANNNILIQAGQAMLAQANQGNQGALRLLQ